MKHRPPLALLALLLAAALAHPLRADDPKPAPAAKPAQASSTQTSFPSTVELVTVDVAVVDKKGKSVAGLTRDDFLVTDNGAPQTVSSFEAVVVPEEPTGTAPARPRPSYTTNVSAETRRGRTFVIVFDDVHLTPQLALRAKGAVSAFLKSGAADGDTVMLVATSGSAWWNAELPQGKDGLNAVLKRLDGRYIPDSSPDRVTEYEAMRIVEFQDMQVADKVQRRFDNYGAVNSQQDPRGVKPPDADSGGAVGIMPELIRSRAEETH
ncbi:MAG TPA: VWA domain-containing protein, partial [Vicinamibacteria bacterium]|nr:VWA domain-containing protein [Vicinamibacteria bacterium]